MGIPTRYKLGSLILILTFIVLGFSFLIFKPQRPLQKVDLARIAEDFVSKHGLRWNKTLRVNQSHRDPDIWEVFSLQDMFVQITLQGEVVGYMDMGELESRYGQVSEDLSPEFSMEVLKSICIGSGIMPEGDLDLVYQFFDRGINVATFKQKVIGRLVEFNWIKFYVKGKDIVAFHKEWTDFKPKKYRVRLSQERAKEIGEKLLDEDMSDFEISSVELIYTRPNDTWGAKASQEIHLAYALMYLSKNDYPVILWIDASDGEILGGHV